MKVLLGVTGSIAAYKAAALVRLFQKRDWDVKVVMTKAATEFVGELTFRSLSRHPVYVEMFPETEEWRPEHIALGEWPDVFLIAPCTANVIAKLAHGISDDLLSCTALAMQAPVVVAPAMNDRMWLHPATQENVACLKERGVAFVDVGSGDLACGYQASGRLADLDDILETTVSVAKEGEA
ncbi:MAG: phosphopantothenoylcysteine decarboxylase [Verrucomicrobia bacterium]|jgi:phosphopantothenoylcysteine synthetase/decarboxylase|nr:phosphopantothenoylcysteine decarboxylase [Verrucomicrobiota bacterium]